MGDLGFTEPPRNWKKHTPRNSTSSDTKNTLEVIGW
jgi:hypothetical protein